ncbi:hypothetical protein C8R45DRAFT_979438 [Mycena sanguinolenta]|nr:hypothetical protein C8R45DRAFT_979438 [Mycena sanguinolenta]
MMAVALASPSSWTSSLPYAPHHHSTHVLQSANWGAPSTGAQKPRLRLAVSLSVLAPVEKPAKFDPFADEPPVARTSQNTPPAPRGRALTPLAISTTPSTSAPTTGRRRAPSFSAGSGTPLPPRVGGAPALASLTSLTLASQRGYYASSSSAPHYAHSTPANYSPYSNPHASSSSSPAAAYVYGGAASAPSPPPSLTRSLPSSRAASPAPAASGSAPRSSDAPTPFHARHYPTPDARARLLARTLLNRIHAVGRRSPSIPRSCAGAASKKSGYENECGGRGYVPSRLSVCTMAC